MAYRFILNIRKCILTVSAINNAFIMIISREESIKNQNANTGPEDTIKSLGAEIRPFFKGVVKCSL